MEACFILLNIISKTFSENKLLNEIVIEIHNIILNKLNEYSDHLIELNKIKEEYNMLAEDYNFMCSKNEKLITENSNLKDSSSKRLGCIPILNIFEKYILIVNNLDRNKRIPLIKMIRDKCGYSLVTAKQLVDECIKGSFPIAVGDYAFIKQVADDIYTEYKIRSFLLPLNSNKEIAETGTNVAKEPINKS